MCSAASAAERVFVITKSVAAKPSSTSTMILLHQPLAKCSSIAIEPCPCGDLPAT